MSISPSFGNFLLSHSLKVFPTEKEWKRGFLEVRQVQVSITRSCWLTSPFSLLEEVGWSAAFTSRRLFANLKLKAWSRVHGRYFLSLGLVKIPCVFVTASHYIHSVCFMQDEPFSDLVYWHQRARLLPAEGNPVGVLATLESLILF